MWFLIFKIAICIAALFCVSLAIAGLGAGLQAQERQAEAEARAHYYRQRLEHEQRARARDTRTWLHKGLELKDQVRAAQQAANEVQEEETWISTVHDVKDLPPTLWCDGYELTVDEAGRAAYAWVYRRAVERGQYNSLNLDDGGWETLLADWYRLQGHTRQRAEEMVLEDWQAGRGIPLSLVQK